MNNPKLSRIFLGAAALALAVVFAVKLASGGSIFPSVLWLAGAVLLGILAFTLSPEDDNVKSAVIGSGVALMLSLMVLSFVAGRATAPAAREHDAAAPTETTTTETPEPATEDPTLAEPSSAPTPTALPYISWTQEQYVDDFNDPTGQTYIRGHFKGTFSNSATSGSRLDVYLYFDEKLSGLDSDCFKIRLFEYGDMLVNYNIIDAKDLLVKIKINGKTYEAHPDRLSEKDIYIKRSSQIYSPIVKALDAGKEISVVITESKYSTSTYRFVLDSYGLADLEHNWKG